MVREVKTSRSFYEPTSIDDLGTYIEKVLIYMLATETLRTPLARAILASPLCREWKCGARNCETARVCFCAVGSVTTWETSRRGRNQKSTGTMRLLRRQPQPLQLRIEPHPGDP